MKELWKQKSVYLTLVSTILTIVFLALYPSVAKDQQVDLQISVLICGGCSVLFGIAEIVLKGLHLPTFGVGMILKTGFLSVAFGIFFMYSLEYLGLLGVYHYSIARFVPAIICVGISLIASVVDLFIGE